jgi:hypothetical protein
MLSAASNSIASVPVRRGRLHTDDPRQRRGQGVAFTIGALGTGLAIPTMLLRIRGSR